MEWKKDPSDDALEKSGRKDGWGNEMSREAGDFSTRGSWSRTSRDQQSSAREYQPRRRRRISEMQNEPTWSYKGGDTPPRTTHEEPGFPPYDTSRGTDFEFDRRRSQEHDYYKEKYNQARESQRQRYENWSDNGSEGRSRNENFERPRYEYRENRYRSNERNGFQSYRKDDLQSRGGYQQNRGNRRPNQLERTNALNRERGYRNDEGRRPNTRGGNPRAELQAKKNTPPVYEDLPFDPQETVRLNKFLSNAGVCSRREADELIKAGAVLVNGLPVTELGVKVTAQDRVEVNGKEVKPENKVYILLNKPRNCVTTTDDPQERLTVMNLVRKACNERIYPVGRLDRNTTGVLLLTNDGELASKLVHPSFKKKKIYHVWLDKEVTVEDMQAIANGIELEDGEMHADAISYAVEDDHTQVGIEIHSGRNRIVRRIFEHLGYHVSKLDRVYFAGLTKKNLGRGKWRYLTQEEVNNLKMGAFD